MQVPLELLDVTADPRDGTAVLVLRETTSQIAPFRVFPLWVDDDVAEAVIVAHAPAPNGTTAKPARLSSALAIALHGRVVKASLVAVQNGIVRAQIHLSQGDEDVTLDAIASDVILLALDHGARLEIDGDLLDYVAARMTEARAWNSDESDPGEDDVVHVSVAQRWHALIEHYQAADDD